MVRMFIFIIVAFNILLSAYWLLHGDIHYDVDVSRDFLVIDDIVRNSHLTLLGPRSGAIPGIFHGPLWFYINLPVFIIGGGNPLLIGWFWFFLSIAYLYIVFWVTKNLFNLRVAVFAVIFLSANSIINPSIGLKNFYNPYGAVFLSPLFFWWLYRYLETLKVKYLVLSLFILGLIIQFQMAFGVPVLITIIPYLSYLFFKKRKILHLFSFLILLIPLSTFILFDLKHEGLQLNALIQFLTRTEGFLSNLLYIFQDRMRALFIDFFDFFSPGKNFLTIFSGIFFLGMFMAALKKSTHTQRRIYWLFGYLFFGFWMTTLFYRGGIGNYFWPFLPLVIIFFCSFSNFIRKEIFLFVFLVFYLANFYAGISAILDFKTDINKRGPHSWAFNLQVAKAIYNDAKGDFGYFTFSPDRFAFQQRYAMIYTAKTFPDITSFSSVKKLLTYLIEVDPPRDRPELDSTGWRISDVKIDRLPDEVFRYDFIKVEKYFLNSGEIQTQPNPYLLDNVFLR